MEQGLHQVKHEIKALITYTRAQVTKILKEAKPPKKNLTDDERKVIKELQQCNDIIIISADKGNCTVVLDELDYHNKLMLLLQNPKIYNIIKKNPILCFEKRLNNFIWKLFKWQNFVVYVQMPTFMLFCSASYLRPTQDPQTESSFETHCVTYRISYI